MKLQWFAALAFISFSYEVIAMNGTKLQLLKEENKQPRHTVTWLSNPEKAKEVFHKATIAILRWHYPDFPSNLEEYKASLSKQGTQTETITIEDYNNYVKYWHNFVFERQRWAKEETNNLPTQSSQRNDLLDLLR